MAPSFSDCLCESLMYRFEGISGGERGLDFANFVNVTKPADVIRIESTETDS